MLRFQSHYDEEKERPDDANDFIVLRTESASDDEGQMSTILDPSLPGNEIADQFPEEFVGEDTLRDDGVGEPDDISYSECCSDPGGDHSFRSWKRSLRSTHPRKSINRQIDKPMPIPIPIPFIILVPWPARAKPVVFFIPPEIFPVCTTQLESREPPIVSLHMESFRKRPKAYRKRTAVACFAIAIRLPLHINETHRFVWSVLFEGGISDRSRGSAHGTILGY
jgi:hypothetical protein